MYILLGKIRVISRSIFRIGGGWWGGLEDASRRTILAASVRIDFGHIFSEIWVIGRMGSAIEKMMNTTFEIPRKR